MKTLKSLLMLCAGLSFCACNSDNDNVLPEGTGKVVVKIVPPTTRAEKPFSEGTVAITGKYDITLLAAKGGAVKENVTVGEEIVFSNVVSPTKVIVSLNDGLKEYADEIDATLGNVDPTAAPAYGETTTFNKVTENSETIFTATVNMAIPVARLEIGKITFEQENSVFDVLTVGGVYMDNLRNRGGLYDAANNKFTCQAESVIDYQFSSDPTTKAEGELGHVLGQEATGSFVGATPAVLPGTKTTVNEVAKDNVYAYNFFGATPGNNENGKNPYFKIYLSETSLTNEAGNKVRYAMITRYKSAQDSNTEIALENGKIYKVTGVDNVIKLSDSNIIDDEDGEVAAYSLEVTVTEATWTLETIYADWAQ